MAEKNKRIRTKAGLQPGSDFLFIPRGVPQYKPKGNKAEDIVPG
jgi:hypothetical protein